jgi:2-polyprenyl-3-methyl-5-hydroxy-6-metoxy-1,4-benzoquinol methylase
MKFCNKQFPDNKSLKEAHRHYPDDMKEGWEYWFYNTNLEEKFRWMLREIPKNCSLLDIGCNSGEMMQMFKSENNCEVHGIDISEDCVTIAKSKGLDAILGDAETLPYKSGIFDCVCLMEIIEHNSIPDNVLGEANRVLKPDGKMVGTTINEDYVLKNTSYRWDDKRLHAKVYDVKSMDKLLNRFFDNVKVKNFFTVNQTILCPYLVFTASKRREDA